MRYAFKRSNIVGSWQFTIYGYVANCQLSFDCQLTLPGIAFSFVFLHNIWRGLLWCVARRSAGGFFAHLSLHPLRVWRGVVFLWQALIRERERWGWARRCPTLLKCGTPGPGLPF